VWCSWLYLNVKGYFWNLKKIGVVEEILEVEEGPFFNSSVLSVAHQHKPTHHDPLSV